MGRRGRGGAGLGEASEINELCSGSRRRVWRESEQKESCADMQIPIQTQLKLFLQLRVIKWLESCH